VIVGLTFGRLYQFFPVPIDLEIAWLVGENKVFEPDGITGACRTSEAAFCQHCLTWLENAGYIATSRISQLGAVQAVLTAKSLEILKAMPASLNAPLGERMVQAAKTEGREALRSLVGQALGMGLQWLGR